MISAASLTLFRPGLLCAWHSELANEPVRVQHSGIPREGREGAVQQESGWLRAQVSAPPAPALFHRHAF